MKRFMTPGVLVPLALAVAGVILIIVGQRLGQPQPTSSLPPIVIPTEVAVATPTPVVTGTPVATATPIATSTPFPEDVVAVQLQVNTQPNPINVAIREWEPPVGDEGPPFPPDDAAFIFTGEPQPGRGTNTFIFAHALEHLFKYLWNARVGDQVLVRMSNEQVLEYRITEVRPNIPCPQAGQDPHPYPPLALQRAGDECDTSWIGAAPSEQLTLQTSQGYNSNWGELVVIAKPVG